MYSACRLDYIGFLMRLRDRGMLFDMVESGGGRGKGEGGVF